MKQLTEWIFTSMNKYLSKVLACITLLAVVVGTIILAYEGEFKFNLIFNYKSAILEGYLYTIFYSAVVFVISCILGFILYLASKSKIKYLKDLEYQFSGIMYGTPLLVLLMIAIYFFADAYGIKNKPLVAIVAFSMYMAPYLKNVYQSMISTLDKEQYIVMDLYGFTSIQKYKYIIFPQIIRPMIPSLLNNLSIIIKGSALFSVISISELKYILDLIQSKHYAYTEGYIVLWGLYLTITIPLTILVDKLTKKGGASHGSAN